MNRLHIIAEAGTNHNGDVETAMHLVDVAHEAGADSVKFQIIHPEGLYVPGFPGPAGYRENPVLEKRRTTELSERDYREIWEHAARRKIPVAASVFDEEGIALLDRMGVPFIKLASCDLNNDRLIRRASETGRQVVIATGMSSFQEIEHAVRVADRSGCRRLVLLHCVSVYPTPVERANVRFVQTLKSEFDTEVGFSDHTESHVASIAAVAFGATWLEKHFTLDRTQEGFDHAYALEPDMLSEYVNVARQAAQAVQHQPQKVGASEAAVAARARRGLYAARDIGAGETVTEVDVLAVRPASALTPRDLSRVLGRTVAHPIPRHTPIDWSHLTNP